MIKNKKNIINYYYSENNKVIKKQKYVNTDINTNIYLIKQIFTLNLKNMWKFLMNNIKLLMKKIWVIRL